MMTVADIARAVRRGAAISIAPLCTSSHHAATSSSVALRPLREPSRRRDAARRDHARRQARRQPAAPADRDQGHRPLRVHHRHRRHAQNDHCARHDRSPPDSRPPTPRNPGQIKSPSNTGWLTQPGRRGRSRRLVMARGWASLALRPASFFASVVDLDAPRSRRDFLRKDYAYLFERYYFLEDQDALGLVVFDELERTRSHLLVDQMARYFGHEGRGEVRAGRVVPEPFFVQRRVIVRSMACGWCAKPPTRARCRLLARTGLCSPMVHTAPRLARLRRPPDGPPDIVAAAERPVDLVQIAASRVELRRRLKAKPLQHLPVLLVSWIGKHLA